MDFLVFGIHYHRQSLFAVWCFLHCTHACALALVHLHLHSLLYILLVRLGVLLPLTLGSEFFFTSSTDGEGSWPGSGSTSEWNFWQVGRVRKAHNHLHYLLLPDDLCLWFLFGRRNTHTIILPEESACGRFWLVGWSVGWLNREQHIWAFGISYLLLCDSIHFYLYYLYHIISSTSIFNIDLHFSNDVTDCCNTSTEELYSSIV